VFVPIALIAIFVWVLTPTDANVERRDIRESGITTTALPVPDRVVMVPEKSART
jgi:hypothetical protein